MFHDNGVKSAPSIDSTLWCEAVAYRSLIADSGMWSGRYFYCRELAYGICSACVCRVVNMHGPVRVVAVACRQNVEVIHEECYRADTHNMPGAQLTCEDGNCQLLVVRRPVTYVKYRSC
jgi:hypothetical protein